MKPIALLIVIALGFYSSGLQAQDLTVKRVVSMEYPALARQARMQGTVKVKCVIGTDGSITSTEIIEIIAAPPQQQGSVRGILGKAAQENARQWKFLRSTSNPNAQAADSIVLSYVFTLRGETRDRARTEFVFDAPNTVLITSQAQLWNP